MTDLPDEIYTQRRAVEEARSRGGRILVTGLGLALVVDEILDERPRTEADSVEQRTVEHITIVERSSDVVELVAPTVRARHGDRIEIVVGDAHTWRPPAGMRFTVAWHDIWPNPQSPGVLSDAELLERHHAPWCDWQGSWVREWQADMAAYLAGRSR